MKIFIFIFCVLSSNSLYASLWERLLMPGDVSQVHAKYENQCDQCHVSFKQQSQIKLCRDCHEKVDKDIHDQQGFHGRIGAKRKMECRNCHSEHKGRKANIVGLIQSAFNHDQTDFKLTGKHEKVACQSCHVKDKKYAEAQADCVACHKEDNIHDDEMGEQCQNCHQADTWKKSKFDHDKTHFSLKEKHKKVRCNACHPDQSYKETPKACLSCHQLQDIHGGLFGKKCQSCHTEKGWSDVFKGHAKKIKFRLKGKHKTITCHACHTDGTRNKKLSSQCVSCHLADDIHQGSQGEKCQRCHDEKAWSKKRFDHSKTGFSLKGRHQKIACQTCHVNKRKHKNKIKIRVCVNCHRQDDSHQGQQGDQCANCHNEKDWKHRLNFDHGLTRFPLVGLHVTASCETCHADMVFSSTDTHCVQCHQQDDLHQGGLGDDCSLCHNPNGWERWSFDHDTQTQYELQGEHRKVACLGCHHQKIQSIEKMKLSQRCQACHLGDDSHRGSYGSACERCHQPTSFTDIKIQIRR